MGKSLVLTICTAIVACLHATDTADITIVNEVPIQASFNTYLRKDTLKAVLQNYDINPFGDSPFRLMKIDVEASVLYLGFSVCSLDSNQGCGYQTPMAVVISFNACASSSQVTVDRVQIYANPRLPNRDINE
uniref:AlNc14C61G4461 protein n=1 Tax=Albugo laibachii Nc14 TaxID=890382 RepID=F0WCT5_9STRA|nr:AlNc14C61G4461 [Albugo laibachii Nc14]|eukprot:CCA19004.1 AlNc14C61G4461 [Albugo laibachii Nc14]